MLSKDSIHLAQQYMSHNAELPMDGWLLYDYRRCNPIFWQLVEEELGAITRPCYLYIPRSGKPVLLSHHVDAGKFCQMEDLLVVYRNRHSLMAELSSLLSSGSTIAMEYSPLAKLPRASKVDAGTVELVRSFGIQITSSADLVQYTTQRWNVAQLASHKRAANKLGTIVLQAFEHVGKNLASKPTEFQIAEFIRRRFHEEGLTAVDGPIVAINSHASDPHYEPQADQSSEIGQGDWLLIDLWAKEDAIGSMYADITWVAYVGSQTPERYQNIFDIVTGARDEALKFLRSEFQEGRFAQGFQADEVAREYIYERGYGDFFTHRLGHSISQEVHGDAVNLDGFETEDSRSIRPGICFSIEPGIYLQEFGVRSEIDVFMSEQGPYATTTVQQEVVLIQG